MNAGIEKDADIGPLISKDAKARCERLIQAGIDQGAQCILDGRGVKVKPLVLMGESIGSLTRWVGS